ncbi:MAG: rRNA maturation RNase YbeY [Fimbriimonadaceae bacterium]|nr:rRNA maturation RNase YbeY [Fimbriimonadaceae bacterium]
MKPPIHKITIVNHLTKRKVHKPISTAVKTALQLFEAPAGEVVVTLAHSAELHELNRTYREMDWATDVLTFPADHRFTMVLGDVILSWEMAELQAANRGVKPVEEAAMLAVHGTLHLLGFDDHNEKDRNEMITAMNRVMRESGLPEDHNWHSLPHESGAQN